jgi:hypothetical protein
MLWLFYLLGKIHPYPLPRMLDKPKVDLVMMIMSSVPAENRTLVIEPTASHFTS